MKKLLKYYLLILPAFAVFYGSYMMTYILQIEEDVRDEVVIGFVQNQVENGWMFLLIAFVFLAGFLIYQLQENRSLTYMYSFPLTRKKVFQKTIGKLNLSMVVAACIYGVLYVVKLRQLSTWDSTKNIVLSGIINVAMLMTKCMMAEVMMLSTCYVWEGILLSGIVLYKGISLVVSNVGYFLQTGCHVTSENVIFQKIFYGLGDGVRLPVELNDTLNSINGNYIGSNVAKTWSVWSENYVGIMVGFSIVFIIVSFALYQVCKIRFGNLDVAPKGYVSRLQGKWNSIVAGLAMFIILFQWITNYQFIYGQMSMGSAFGSGVKRFSVSFLTLLIQKTSMQMGGEQFKYPATSSTWLAILVSIIGSIFILIIYKKGRGLYEKHFKARKKKHDSSYHLL